MELTTENVTNVFKKCLFNDNENISNPIIAEGITAKFGFNQKRLNSHINDITDMLSQLPKEFQRDSGGGTSFLNACDNANGEQWTGLHEVMELLFMLGLATGNVQCLMPRDMWKVLPGGMPYYVVM